MESHEEAASQQALTEVHSEKRNQIVTACQWKDIDSLRALAISEGGLISDDLRNQAWPLLLGVPTDTYEDHHVEAGWRNLPAHRDEDQVRLDVDRSFIYYPTEQTPIERESNKKDLSDLITEVLRRHPYLSYFQGYHDICQVLLLVLKPRKRVSAVARLSVLRIRDFMLPNLAPALAQLRLIPSILYAANPRLCAHISQTQPFFALSGTLTMYAHDIQEYGDISRLFDVLLAREAVFSVYLFAQIVLQRSDELFDTPADEPEMLHSILSKLPKPLNIESLIKKTLILFNQHPPETLGAWHSISRASVLKTTRWQDQSYKQSLEDGKVFFQQQVRQLHWSEVRNRILERLWKYRRPAGAAGLAVFIGLFSVWFRMSGQFQFWKVVWRSWAGYSGGSSV